MADGNEGCASQNIPSLSLIYFSKLSAFPRTFAKSSQKQFTDFPSFKPAQPKMSVISESASVASVSASEAMTVAEIISATKHMTSADLFKLLKLCTTEVEKRTKSDAKATTTKKRQPKEKKEKGPVPNQLKKNHAWVAFTLKHAQENGWEEFVIHKKDEEIVMPASQLHEGANIYEDSINDKTPKGRQINRSEAMSLAKVRKEANHSSWEEFEAQFVPDESTASESSDDTKSTTSSKKSVTRKTAAEKEREKEEKKAAKEKEKAEKKAEKEAAAAVKKAEKEAEKAKKAAEKEEKKPAAAPAKATPAPAPKKAAGGAGAKASDTETDTKPAKAVKKVTVKKVEDASEKIPTVADDGQAHLVTWKGKSYYMMASGEAWIQNKDKSMGKWAGMFDETKNILDETVEEPTFDEE